MVIHEGYCLTTRVKREFSIKFLDFFLQNWLQTEKCIFFKGKFSFEKKMKLDRPQNRRRMIHAGDCLTDRVKNEFFIKFLDFFLQNWLQTKKCIFQKKRLIRHRFRQWEIKLYLSRAKTFKRKSRNDAICCWTDSATWLLRGAASLYLVVRVCHLWAVCTLFLDHFKMSWVSSPKP